MADLFSPYATVAWPDVATSGVIPGLATIVAWLIAHLTAAVLAGISYRPPLWARITAPIVIIALAIWWVRWVGRPAKLGRPSRRQLARPVDQRQSDGER